MAGGRANIGGRVAVGAAAAILAVCAAGGPLYVSSAASQAVQIQLDDGCLADDGMHLTLLFDQAHPRLDAAVRTVAHTTGPLPRGLGGCCDGRREQGGRRQCDDGDALLHPVSSFPRDVAMATA